MDPNEIFFNFIIGIISIFNYIYEKKKKFHLTHQCKLSTLKTPQYINISLC